MIPINRSSVALPEEIIAQLEFEAGKAKDFFLSKETSQERFPFNAKAWRKAKPSLQDLFHDKCAFCESKLVFNWANIELFRPKSIYWWLAYEWENLYYACQTCNISKGALFPIAGTIAKRFAKGAELEAEKNLLLDPCLDKPHLHLRFDEQGEVHGISLNDSKTSAKYKGFDRGKVTIDTFRLNRSDLKTRRQNLIQYIDTFFAMIEKELPSDYLNKEALVQIINFTAPMSAYSGMSRQLIARKLSENTDLYELFKKSSPDFIAQIEPELEMEKSLAKSDSPAKVNKKPQIKVAEKPREIEYDNAYITGIELHNFKAIEELKISVNTIPEINGNPDSSGDSLEDRKVGWKMLLGENGSGKSSVLKALSMALMGKDYYKENKVRYRLEPEQILNNKRGKKDGYIKVRLSKGEAIEIHFTKKNVEFTSGITGGAQVFFRAYGAARFFSRQAVAETLVKRDVIKEVTNLFQPDKMLADPNGWLVKLKKDEFDNTAKTFRDLLNISKEVNKPLVKKGNQVLLNIGSGPKSLAEQSDGYNSVLALITDIMAGLAGLPQGDKKSGYGIVLLDEIDAHLHPSWKMRITASLRRCFPHIQFIATTHEPLCLRGLGEQEITILRKEDDKIIVQDDVPSPEGLRVDQLLTSELFGLESTIDPDIDEKFQEYYQLLAQDSLTDEHKARRDALSVELDKYNTLGFTRRDRMVYELIDTYIAKKNLLPQEEEQKLLVETKDRVMELWNLTKLRNSL